MSNKISSLRYTTFPNFAATRKEDVTTSPEMLLLAVENGPTRETKDQLPWLKLARFGSRKTSKGCLRSDDNVVEVTGIEADYDGEQMPFDAAVEQLQGKVEAIIYTSPSHTPDKPRWRILALLAKPLVGSADEMRRGRAAHLATLQSLIPHAKFANESKTLSQSYFFGCTKSTEAYYNTVQVSGPYIDELQPVLHSVEPAPIFREENLPDKPWIKTDQPAPAPHPAPAAEDERQLDASYITFILRGELYHESIRNLSARYVWRNMDRTTIINTLQGIMEACQDRSPRWQQRYNDIGRTVDGAIARYGNDTKPDSSKPDKILNRLLRPSDMAQMARPEALIRNVLYSNQEHVLFGPQGVSKTFMVIHMMLCMAHGLEFAGKPTKVARSVMFCGEGGGRVLQDRIDAFYAADPTLDPAISDDMIRITEFPVYMMLDEHVDFALNMMDEFVPQMIFVDTLAANFGGGDENAVKDMTVFWDSFRRIRLALDCGMVLIHHTGHDKPDRPQGSNIIRRNPDIELRIDRCHSDADLFGLQGGGALKNRNGKGCGILGYRLKEVKTGFSDNDGFKVKSCVIEFTDEEPDFDGLNKQKTSSKGRGKNQVAIHTALSKLKLDENMEAIVTSELFIQIYKNLGLSKHQASRIKKGLYDSGAIRDTIGGFIYQPLNRSFE